MHPLQNKNLSTMTLKKQRVGVRCESRFVDRKKCLVALADEGAMVLLKEGVLLLPLGDRGVFDSDGNLIEPTGSFYITAETIDPYHIVTDVF